MECRGLVELFAVALRPEPVMCAGWRYESCSLWKTSYLQFLKFYILIIFPVTNDY